MVAINDQLNDWTRQAIERETKVHSALKHKHILELIGAAKLTPEQAARGGYFPAYYLLMEMAAGGDLFDKIRTLRVGVGSGKRLMYCLQSPMSVSTKMSHTGTFVRCLQAWLVFTHGNQRTLCSPNIHL